MIDHFTQSREHLQLIVKTVEVHSANIKDKLDIKIATNLMRSAVRWMDSRGGN